MLRHVSFAVICCLFAIFTACETDDFSTNPADKLVFSADTVAFDTVFTALGSRTEVLKVFNPNKKALKISHISLEKGSNSFFKINVDGATNKNYQFADIEILPKDSIYIFITLKIDPNNANTPILVDDDIRFELNNNRQDVHLEAFGQDVEILRNRFIFSDSTLSAHKPYLIYDTLFIAENKTLSIDAGAKLYFHKNAVLIALGNLRAEGTIEKPIEMRGDRLDNLNFSDYPLPYNYVAGQWSGIFLLGNNGNHLLKNVRINSADVGIYLYNEDKTTLPKLQLENCRLHNFLFYGLVVQNADVKVLNSEISNAASHCVYLNGGNHTFVHCTVANYFGTGQNSSRSQEAAVMIYNLGHEAQMATKFLNCVIMGSLGNEFALLTDFPQQYNGTFADSYIRRTDTLAYTPQFQQIKWHKQGDVVFRNTPTDFKDNNYFDFQLDSVSPARNIANPSVTNAYGLQLDFLGNDRTTDGQPDAGAYEMN
jgi:parallel beta-helix repeat protein